MKTFHDWIPIISLCVAFTSLAMNFATFDKAEQIKVIQIKNREIDEIIISKMQAIEKNNNQ